MVPTNLQDTGALDELFSVFDRNYTITDAGGNSMAVVRLIQSTTSIYLSSHLKVKTTIIILYISWPFIFNFCSCERYFMKYYCINQNPAVNCVFRTNLPMLIFLDQWDSDQHQWSVFWSGGPDWSGGRSSSWTCPRTTYSGY